MHTSATEHGTDVALIFALVAERLSVYYEHHQWLTQAQGASLSADWLAKSKRVMPLDKRRRLSSLSDQLAREIAATLSREAGLYTAHEMTESLDPNYHSDIAQSLMLECERMLEGNLTEQGKA
ncbi:MAG: hypothetical protein HY306_05575 [Nitrosomonadales bacterium]|nr:hypothetical protein [Nitrosomonadales bacterium]